MRGRVDQQASMFVAFNVEDTIPDAHPLRKVKRWAEAILLDIRADLRAAYSEVGRPGIPPEQMLKALLLHALYAIPSERRLMEAIEFKAERRSASGMLRRVERRHGLRPRTLGADRGYDDGSFLADLESRGITPHIPVKEGRLKARDEPREARRRARRRMGQVGCSISQRVRKRAEQVIGWAKGVTGLARMRFIGHARIAMDAMMSGAAHNLLRMTRLRPC